MFNIYKLFDIFYFINTLLLAMINFGLNDKKTKYTTVQQGTKWVSLDNDTNEWGWVDDQI